MIWLVIQSVELFLALVGLLSITVMSIDEYAAWQHRKRNRRK